MWVDHILFDRPLSQLSINKLSYNNGALSCEVQVKGNQEVKEVNLVYALTENPEFLNTSLTRHSNKDNYTQAKWEVVPMIRKGGSWVVNTMVINPGATYAACFVHVSDSFAGRPGHVTSITCQLPENN